MSRRSPDQDLIDELARWLDEPDREKAQTNGHAKAPTRAGTSASPPTDEMVIEKCRGAENAAKFSDLFDHGDVYAHHGGDDSAADLALLGILAFWTQGEAQLERLFSDSALGRREKWRNRSDYRERTKRKALPDPGDEVYDWSRERRRRVSGSSGAATEFVSSEHKERGSEETKSFPFKTAREAAAAVPEKTEWVAAPYIAKGSITEIDGKIKAAGKTTFISHLVADVVEGRPFMDTPTTKTRVVWLTEQSPASFRTVLARAGLTECDDVFVLHWHDVAEYSWPDVARAAEEKALEVGAGLLIADTLGQFTGIRGDGENSAGEAHEAMKPLQQAAANGLAVIVSRHERKGGGEVGEAGRGSSAFGGAVDVIMSLRRLGGNHSPNVRSIEALSRFEETPDKIVVELTPRGYRNLGNASAFSEQEAMDAIMDLLPTRAEHAIETGDLLDKLGEQDIKRSTANDALRELVKAGTARRLGAGKRGSPYCYYKPEPTESGTEAGEEFVSSEPLSYSSEETKKGAGENGARTVADLFADPPDWLPGQLDKYRENPETNFGPLCAAVAAAVLDEGGRVENAAEEVRQELRKRGEEAP